MCSLRKQFQHKCINGRPADVYASPDGWRDCRGGPEERPLVIKGVGVETHVEVHGGPGEEQCPEAWCPNRHRGSVGTRFVDSEKRRFRKLL